MRFIEGDIPRNPHAASNGISAAIAFVFSVVPKKDTLNRLGSQLGSLTRRKKNVADTTKTTEMGIGMRRTEKTLVGRRALKSRGGLSINQKDSHRDSLSPKMRSEISGNEKSLSCLKNMVMLTLSNTILSMSTRA